jgi:hypothetical protein
MMARDAYFTLNGSFCRRRRDIGVASAKSFR